MTTGASALPQTARSCHPIRWSRRTSRSNCSTAGRRDPRPDRGRRTWWARTIRRGLPQCRRTIRQTLAARHRTSHLGHRRQTTRRHRRNRRRTSPPDQNDHPSRWPSSDSRRRQRQRSDLVGNRSVQVIRRSDGQRPRHRKNQCRKQGERRQQNAIHSHGRKVRTCLVAASTAGRVNGIGK